MLHLEFLPEQKVTSAFANPSLLSGHFTLGTQSSIDHAQGQSWRFNRGHATWMLRTCILPEEHHSYRTIARDTRSYPQQRSQQTWAAGQMFLCSNEPIGWTKTVGSCVLM